MTQEIKQRIEQIKRGEVPQGYKKTKVGIVPSEWELDTLSRCIIEIKELSNELDKYQVFSSSRIGLLPKSEYFDNREAEETNLGYKIVPPAYVTYRHMSDDDIFHFNINETGKTILVSAEYPVFNSAKKSCLGFIIPILNNTSRFRYFCKCQKLGGTRTRLYLKTLSTYQLALPPIFEQEKIASILTTCDKVIELKEKLLAEKQAQKKWLMQKLLTGKKRLSGFRGKWRKEELGNVFEYEQPTAYLVNSTNYDNKYRTPVLTAGKTFILGYTDEIDGVYRDVPVIIFDDFTTASKYVDFPFKAKSSAMKILKCKEKCNIVFAFAALQELKYTVGGHERHWISKFAFIPINLPSLTEQTAIAEILSTADREIDLMKKDIDAEKQKKKALMQILLTGLVRVNV